MGEQRRVFILLLIFCFLVVSISELGILQAQSTISIEADGSVEGTDRIQRVGNIYTFTDNIVNQLIVVERDDIVVDGAGYSLQGTGSDAGITLNGRSNVTIKNVEIMQFRYGIMLRSSSNNVLVDNNAHSNSWAGIQFGFSSNHNIISGNDISNNSEDGIALYSSSFNIISGNNIINHNRDGVAFYSWSNNNTLSENNITNSSRGIRLDISSFNTLSGNYIADNYEGIFAWSSNHKIFHNIFINNTIHAGGFEVNTWDDGYPSGGNVWSDNIDVDLLSGPNQDEIGSDGIWDHPYIIDHDNQDNYPMIPEFSLWILLPLITSLSFVVFFTKKKLEKI
jgi:parallel beta-helix repeat protein